MSRKRNRNAEREEQLGMPWATACNKLRKEVLFCLLKKHKENICYRCGCEIDDIKSLSIDHKTRWFNSDTPQKLFWDMGNILFSHRECNCIHGIRSYRGDDAEHIEQKPESFEWCSRCRKFLPLEVFTNHVNKRRRRQVEQYCRSCQSVMRKEKVLKNK